MRLKEIANEHMHKVALILSLLLAYSIFLPWISFRLWFTPQLFSLFSLTFYSMSEGESYAIFVIAVFLLLNGAIIIGIVGGVNPDQKNLIIISGVLGFFGGFVFPGLMASFLTSVQSGVVYPHTIHYGVVIELICSFLMILLGIVLSVSRPSTVSSLYQRPPTGVRTLETLEPVLNVKDLKEELQGMTNYFSTILDTNPSLATLGNELIQRTSVLDFSVIERNAKWIKGFIDQTKAHEQGKVSDMTLQYMLKDYQEHMDKFSLSNLH